MFTEEDMKRAAQFGQFLLKAKMDLAVSEWLEFNRLLIWYNGMAKKISENILEVKDVTPPKEKPKKVK